jgi:hypothetical protein
MPGNSKNKRKSAPKGIGTVERMVDRLQTGLIERQKRIIAKNERNDRLNNLPMSHPMNASRVSVFGAIDKMIDEEEATGGLLFSSEGKAVMWESRMQDWVEVVSSLLAVTHLMRFIGRKYTLGEMPAGLTAFALKVDRGDKINDSDRTDARAACAWIRSAIGKITPTQWKVAHDEYEAIERRLSEREMA